MFTLAIVNDTEIAIEALRRAIATVPDYQLTWVARTGSEAVQRCAEQRPDVVLMDINMPHLDGVAATRQIMQRSPCAILIVTASVTIHTAKVFEAMGYGALDVVKTPRLGAGDAEAVQTLLSKIRTITKLIHRTHHAATVQTSVPARSIRQSAPSLPLLVAIGASTGGPKALKTIFSQLPPDLKAAIVVVQHIDVQFAPGLVEWLNRFSTLPVALAHPGSAPTPGQILVAGTNDHLILRPNRTLRHTRQPATYPHRPSVDVFFCSVAQHWPRPGLGILLTGMGRDGAMGLGQLRAADWSTIVESAESCVVYGMPRAAVEANAARRVLPVAKMAKAIAAEAIADSNHDR
ncbi:MAG: chemotaxis-specific protein-glutamate methyltransferase CheB [Leptolyngbya sp. SIOISBB]|nr:chemotaxis-specific protein-glutamate methyltransferase CheB [Leptolyngbya sp. SIOISBB]